MSMQWDRAVDFHVCSVGYFSQLQCFQLQAPHVFSQQMYLQRQSNAFFSWNGLLNIFFNTLLFPLCFRSCPLKTGILLAAKCKYVSFLKWYRLLSCNSSNLLFRAPISHCCLFKVGLNKCSHSVNLPQTLWVCLASCSISPAVWEADWTQSWLLLCCI